MIIANAAVGRTWATHAAGILCGLTAGITFLIGALDLAGAGLLQIGRGQEAGVDWGIMLTGALAAALASRPLRKRLAGFLPIDPDSPVHAYALVLVVVFFGAQVSSIVFVDLLAVDQSQPPLTLGDLVGQEAPFLILALAGVGLFTRRSAAAAAQRLGLSRPAWWHVTLALAAAGAFFVFIQMADGLTHQLTPEVARRVDKTTTHIFSALNDPLGIAALAIVPGICEEILFRGALQPRIGVIATALLFTSIHTQYGLSIDTLAIFVVALGLGTIRKYTNTTTSGLCHISYNLLAGIGIADSLIWIAVPVELALVGVSGYAIWSRKRQPAVVV